MMGLIFRVIYTFVHTFSIYLVSSTNETDDHNISKLLYFGFQRPLPIHVQYYDHGGYVTEIFDYKNEQAVNSVVDGKIIFHYIISTGIKCKFM